ncbi:unnamed protein product [Tuber aestivum]|uniref:Uncharacterized protein n=1 Tax=Tuber aestivum TaxID=59557 RepID=A0A292PLZ8_9PEZI|nr:unnamed protein product [Tuber aestivum]
MNVFLLGHIYLQLGQILEVRLPHIGLTVYLYRFARDLDFGYEQTHVTHNALRISQSRMINFCLSVKEVVYVVKVADLTIQKRLDELKNTKGRELSVEEFRNIRPKASKKRKQVRNVNDDGEDIEDRQNITIVAASIYSSAAPSASTLLRLLDKHRRLDSESLVTPELPVPWPLPISSLPITPIDIMDDHTPQGVEKPQVGQHSAIAEEVIESEFASQLDGSAALIKEELQETDLPNVPNNLDGVGDDFEVQNALLTAKGCDLKEKIRLELNKYYLLKRLKRETDLRNRII